MLSPSPVASTAPVQAAPDASGQDALGASPAPGGVRFRAFATAAPACSVRLFDGAGKVLGTHPMQPQGGGFFELTLTGVGPGALYKLVLEGPGDAERELPDPYARFLPQGVHGPAQVIASAHRFRHSGVYRPLSEHVLYELHVGTFTPEGTYAGVRARLPELKSLGVTAIELMPVAAFAGERGWGYDGVALYAPFAGYGTPDELRALVDEAHALGLAVFLDVVYNHFGPAGNYLAAYSPEYFTPEIQNGWGDAPDYRHPVMRRLVLDNARYWLTEFRFDGLRLDATHAIVDPSGHHILSELAELAAALEPRRLLIAEDERNQPELIERHRLDAIWADDFHHQLRVTLTGEQDGYYAGYQPGVAALAETIRGGWLYQGQVYPPSGRPRGASAERLPAEGFVYCIQNHDQIGNRALGERLNHQVPLEAFHASSTLLLFLPMTPLLFMGQEWAASSPFLFFTDHDAELGRAVSKGRREEFKSFQSFSDPGARSAIPDPQDPDTFSRSRLDWSERERTAHAETLSLYRRLLELRRTDPVLASSSRSGLQARAEGSILLVERQSPAGHRLLAVNLAPTPAPLPDALLARYPRQLLTTGHPPTQGTLPGFSALIRADS